jgi:hypothetical protein
MLFETAVLSHGNIVRSSIASARLLHIVVFVVAVTARGPSSYKEKSIYEPLG